MNYIIHTLNIIIVITTINITNLIKINIVLLLFLIKKTILIIIKFTLLIVVIIIIIFNVRIIYFIIVKKLTINSCHIDVFD